MNSMCLFMENIFTGTKYIQNVVENLEEAFQTKTKRGIGVSLAGASFSQDRIKIRIHFQMETFAISIME